MQPKQKDTLENVIFYLSYTKIKLFKASIGGRSPIESFDIPR